MYVVGSSASWKSGLCVCSLDSGAKGCLLCHAPHTHSTDVWCCHSRPLVYICMCASVDSLVQSLGSHQTTYDIFIFSIFRLSFFLVQVHTPHTQQTLSHWCFHVYTYISTMCCKTDGIYPLATLDNITRGVCTRTTHTSVPVCRCERVLKKILPIKESRNRKNPAWAAHEPHPRPEPLLRTVFL